MALTKIDDRGLKTPIDLIDNEKIRLGTGNDLELYHSGSDSWIKHDGTGLLVLATADLQVTNVAGSEQMIRATADGSVQLFYNNTKQFETIDGGIRVSDNQDIQAGTSGDLLLKHDGTNSWIKNLTGTLVAATADFQVASVAGDEQMIRAYDDGAVELYHNNLKKFETQAHGIQVTDSDTNVVVKLETSSGTAGYLYGASNTECGILDAQGHNAVLVTKDAAVELYYNNLKHFYTTIYGSAVKRVSGGQTEFDVLGCEGNDATIRLLPDDGDDNADYWKLNAAAAGGFFLENLESGSWETNIKAVGGGAVELFYNNTKQFETVSNGTRLRESQFAGTEGDNTSPWGLNSAGNRGWNWQDVSNKTTFSIVNNSQYAVMYLNKITAGSVTDNRWIDFRWDGAQVGTLDYVNNDVVITQQSDYRLKENIVGITDGIAKVKQLNPVKFNFKADAKGKDSSILNEGFLAHELQTVIPQAASGVKDATKVDEEGNTVPDYQGIWMPKMIPMLTAALQEAIAKIETLETKVAALEAA